MTPEPTRRSSDNDASKIDALVAKHRDAMADQVRNSPYPAGTYPNLLPETINRNVEAAVRDTWASAVKDYEDDLVIFIRRMGNSPTFVNDLLAWIRTN